MACSQCIIDLGNVADWLAAIGTIGATALALYFGLRGRGERLTIGFSVADRRLAMFVVNSSDRPVHIEDLELELGRWKPTPSDHDVDLSLILTTPNRTPALLGPRESLTFRADLGDDSSYLGARLERAYRGRPWFDRRLYLIVVTGERARIKRRVPTGVLAAVIEHGYRINKRRSK